jgi:hypothetical protein
MAINQRLLSGLMSNGPGIHFVLFIAIAECSYLRYMGAEAFQIEAERISVDFFLSFQNNNRNRRGLGRGRPIGGLGPMFIYSVLL